MTCERCQGLMVGKQMCDLLGTGGNLCVEGFRCLLCGNITDATILENSEARLPPSSRSYLQVHGCCDPSQLESRVS